MPKSSEKETFRQHLSQIDFFGVLLLIAGIVCVLLAASFGGNQYPWNSLMVIVLFVGGGIFLIFFILNEKRYTSNPVIALRLFTIRNVVLTSISSLIVGFVLLGGLSYMPEYFQVVQGDSPTTSGLKIIPLMAGLVVGSIFSGMFISKVN